VSYTGVGTIGSHIAHESASPDDSGMVAARDITRLNGIGQLVVMVPKGQPIPKGVAVDPADATPGPAPAAGRRPDPGYLHRPEPDIGGQYATALRTERALNLFRRSP